YQIDEGHRLGPLDQPWHCPQIRRDYTVSHSALWPPQRDLLLRVPTRLASSGRCVAVSNFCLSGPTPTMGICGVLDAGRLAGRLGGRRVETGRSRVEDLKSTDKRKTWRCHVSTSGTSGGRFEG